MLGWEDSIKAELQEIVYDSADWADPEKDKV
jgi:hypothetical protein